MSDPRQLERYAERLVSEVDSANRDIKALLGTIREIEQFAAEVDTVDLRKAIGLKTDISRLQTEVRELQSNLRMLASELSDTNLKIQRALY